MFLKVRDNEPVFRGSSSDSLAILHKPTVIPFGWQAILAVLVAATILVGPLIVLGNPYGHDVIFHVSSWMEVAQQWRQGIVYPRWAAGANYGLGEPRFIFYPPLDGMLGAVLSLVLPWKTVPGAFVWLVLVIAGTSVFRLARECMSRSDAAWAAVLYAANPYYQLVIYQRCAFAELLASAFFPLVVLYGLRVGRQGLKSVASLALVFAAVYLMDPPSAVIVTYSLPLLLVIVALVRKWPRLIVFGAAAMALGFLLVAFYIVPAALEQKWISLGFRWSVPDKNFLFTRLGEAWRIRFDMYVSAVALAEIGATACAILLSREERRKWPEIWWTLVALS